MKREHPRMRWVPPNWVCNTYQGSSEMFFEIVMVLRRGRRHAVRYRYSGTLPPIFLKISKMQQLSFAHLEKHFSLDMCVCVFPYGSR